MPVATVSSGQSAKAIEYYKEALNTSGTVSDYDSAIILNDMGNAYSSMGEYQKSLECLEKALESLQKIGNLREEGNTQSNIGLVYFNMGQYRKSLECYEKALDINRRTGHIRAEASSLEQIGKFYHVCGERRKALEYYEKALEINKKTGNLSGQSKCFFDIGRVCFGFDKYDEALQNIERTIEINIQIGWNSDDAKNFMAWAYIEKGDLDKAEGVLKEVSSYARDRSGAPPSNYALAKLYLLRADYSNAKAVYEKMLETGEKRANVRLLIPAYTGLAKVCESQEDYKKAEEYFERAMRLTEEMRLEFLPSERANFFDVRMSGFYRSEPAKGLTRVRMKLNQTTQSIDSSEATRARAFSDNISQRTEVGYSGVPSQLLQKEDELVSKVAALKKELAKTDKDKSPTTYENLSKQAREAEAGLNSFVGMLWEKYEAYASVKYPRPVTLKESALKPEEYVVIFDVSGEGVGVKLVKGKEISETFYKKWKLDNLEKDVKKFRQAFEEIKLREFDTDLGQSLVHQTFIKCFSEVPKGTPLVIIPDGILSVLPFEALVVSGKATWNEDSSRPYPEGLTYLGDVYPISYYQSITAMTLARTLGSKEKTGAKTMVIADPVFDSDDPRLKASSSQDRQKLVAGLPEKLMSIKSQTGISFPRLSQTSELADSLKKLNPGATDLFTGMQAKKNILFDKPMTSYGSIIFATHGYFGNDIPTIREPVLAMTLVDQPKDQDGFLRMTEVMGMKLNANVVALTACQTGIGSNLSGEGVMSMGRAFQYAGAKSILMSLWSVSESGSVLLVEKFFEHLNAGKNKLEALRLAREDVRNTGYNHPFYWASFILVGEVN